MSTKNLARTVIEGGRRPGNRDQRRESNATVRTQTRLVSARVVQMGDDAADYPRRESVHRSFNDKTRPAERWLASQVGRPWNHVRSELFARFDARTTAGRHILFEHLLREVNLNDVARARYSDFTVDRHGLLRRERERRRYRWPTRERLPEPESVLLDWLDGRRVGERDERLYWFVPTEFEHFRQHHELVPSEIARWRTLPAGFRARFAVVLSGAAS